MPLKTALAMMDSLLNILSLSTCIRNTHYYEVYSYHTRVSLCHHYYSFFLRSFWKIVREFSEDQKKRLLSFITGSDRIPLGGLAKLKFVIVKNGPDSDR